MRRMLLAGIIAVTAAACASSLWAEVKGDYGLNLRLRHEYWRDVFDLNNGNGNSAKKPDFSFYRVKISPWGKLSFDGAASVFLMLSAEPRVYKTPEQAASHGEMVFDNFYVDIPAIACLPLSARIGRQDLRYGEGFILMDGTPGDGSRTFYFNAAKLTFKMSGATSIDFLAIADPKRDRFLPVINDQFTDLNSSDEEAYGLYAKSDLNEVTHLEPYYIHKIESPAGAFPRLLLNTVGIRSTFSLAQAVLSAEAACQTGSYSRTAGTGRTGYGGNLFLKKDFKGAPLNLAVNVGVVYFSADDPSTADIEAWDPVFSRWPYLSELYVFTLANESGGILSYWANMQWYRAELIMKPFANTETTLRANYLLANRNVAGFGTGKERGWLPQVQIKYQFMKNVSAYVLGEYFIPGDFYAADARDNALFTRVNVDIKL